MVEILKLGGAAFQPSAALTGNEQQTVLRGQNMMLRGSEGSFYFEVFGGIKNLNEPIPMGPMTGTLDYTAGDVIIRGNATLFKSELRPGMKISAAAQVFAVKDVLSNTRFVAGRAPDANGTAVVPAKFPIMFEINNKRGTLVWGNAVRSDRGNIIAVGEGNLRINGQVLAGEELHASNRVKLAIYRPTTDDYEIGSIGYSTAPLISWVSISTVAGGTRDMTQGVYSYRYSWANSETAYGFSNPSDVIKLDGSGNPIAISATNQRHAIDFTVALTHKPSNADAVIIYRSLFSDPVQNPTQAGEGSWFVAKTVKIEDFEAGDIVYIDVLDGELGTEVTFDNDPPPNADWVTFLGGDPILISCYGEKTTTNSSGDSPGPFVSIAKRQNRDAFPAALATPLSPPDTIIGFVPSVGRLFLLTRVGLPFAASTGQSDFPVTTRAFWQTGFESPFGLVFVNDTLYGFTSKGVTRSIATGDEGSEQFAFASFVEDITRDWHASYVHSVHDPQNELVVFIYSAAYKNDAGFWVSLALPLYLRYGIFGPLITIEKPDRDMVVCGAAKVEGHLQFLAGGRGAVENLSSEEGSGSGSSEENDLLLHYAPIFGTDASLFGPAGFSAVISNPSTFIAGERWSLENGDIMVLATVTADIAVTVTDPTGWAEAPNSPVINTGNVRIHIFWKRIDVTEGPITLSNTADQVALLQIFHGCVETGDPWDVTASSTGAGTSPTLPSVTTTLPGTTAVFMLGHKGSSDRIHSWQNANIPEIVEHSDVGDNGFLSSNLALVTACGFVEAAGATGVTTVDKESEGANQYAAWTGALKPQTILRPHIVWPSIFYDLAGVGDNYGFYPKLEVGDYFFIFIETADEAVTVPGYTEAPGSPVRNLTGGDHTRLSVFYRKYLGTEDMEPALDDKGPHAVATVVAIRGAIATGDPFDVTSTGDTGTGTGVSVPGATTTTNNCLVIAAVASSILSGGSANYTGWANSDLSDVTEVVERETTSSNGTGGAVAVASGGKVAAGAYGATTVLQATSGEWATWSGAIKPSGVDIPTVLPGAGVFNVTNAYNGAPLPQNLQADDLLVMIVETPNTEASVVQPAGWTMASNTPVINAGGSPARLTVFWKRATGVRWHPEDRNTAFYTPDISFVDHLHVTSMVIRNLDPDDPFDAHDTITGGGTSIVLPGLTSSVDNAYFIAAVGTTKDANTVLNTFSGWTNSDIAGFCAMVDAQTNTGTGGGSGVAAGVKTVAGSIGATMVTQNVSVAWAGWVCALKPLVP
jgi:hypothetical protein